MSSKKLPKDFLWGFATASYQIEGSPEVDGRGLSIWDKFSRTPGKTKDGKSGDVATDSYKRFKEDVALLKSYGCNAYRFSISWSRVIPQGGRNDPVNEKGLQFYSNLVDELLANGITPFVTLYHWDLPLALDERYGGWLNKDEAVADFERYARVCFEALGDRVKYWLTFNEPWCIAIHGYRRGLFAPGHVSDTEPWIVGHTLLVAHGRVARLYQKEFKGKQGGQIGITLNGDWSEPYDKNDPSHVAAAQQRLDFNIGWFAEPIYGSGDYPESMRRVLKERLPSFTEEEKKIIHGSSEFYGCNTYTTNLVKPGGDDESQGLAVTTFKGPDGKDIGVQSYCDWLQNVPWGFRKLLNYLYKRYHLPIYVTENGFAVQGEHTASLDQAIDDRDRVDYFVGYTRSLLDAVTQDGVVVKSYFAWTLADNFEWAEGYTARFGATHINFDTQERTPKASAKWLSQFFKETIEK